MEYKIDLSGKRFGRLVVLEYAGKKKSGSQNKTLWKCICDCGNEKITDGGALHSGHTTSCGCLHKEIFGALNRKHNLAHKCNLYSVWKSMNGRCKNPKDKSYKNYGGRGIEVCEEWQNDFKAFYDWAYSVGYNENKTDKGINILTLDRINNDGNYCPENCRWVSNLEQANNKRNTMTNEERYNVCPVCGKKYKKTQRNGSKTCSKSCGAKRRYLVIKNGL